MTRTVSDRVRAALREDAIAMLAGDPTYGADDRERMIRAALREYRQRWPECRATQPWLFYDGDPTTRLIRGTPKRVDVYCLFCREMLVNGAVWQRDYTVRVEPHTTRCALLVLAGRLEPGQPCTYRLPEAVP